MTDSSSDATAFDPSRVQLVPFLPEDRIQQRVADLARACADTSASSPSTHGSRATQHKRDFSACRSLALVGLQHGSFVFLADLARNFAAMGCHPYIDFIRISQYAGETEARRPPTLLGTPDRSLAHKHVILVDDILDTGFTLQAAVQEIEGHHPASVRTCVLLDKPERRRTPFEADYRGFEIANHFVVGYGLDYRGFFRELPYIARPLFG